MSLLPLQVHPYLTSSNILEFLWLDETFFQDSESITRYHVNKNHEYYKRNEHRGFGRLITFCLSKKRDQQRHQRQAMIINETKGPSS